MEPVTFTLTDVFICPSTGNVYLTGLQQQHSSVAVRVHGYYPFFFIRNTVCDTSEQRTKQCAQELSQLISSFTACEKGEFVGIDVVCQKLFFGYSAEPKYLLKIYCKTKNDIRSCVRTIKDQGYDVLESDKDLTMAFLREQSLYIYGTITLHEYSEVSEKQRFSRCIKDYSCKLQNISGEQCTNFPQLYVAAYDLETEGLNADIHAVIQVSICIREFPFTSSQVVDKILISTLHMQEGDEFKTIVVNNERELVECFVDTIRSKHISILCGWNNLGFDAPFLYKRAVKNRCVTTLEQLSYLLPHVSKVKLVEKSLDSSAFGTNHFSAYTGRYGITEVDGLLLARKSSSLKLNSYSLNNVAKELLSSAKDDVTYKDIQDAISSKDPELVFKVAKYCVQDSYLVLQIFEHLKEVENIVVMSSLTNLPAEYIAIRGQCVKVLSLVYGEAFRRNYVWNQPKRQGANTKYQGSTVIDSQTGLYTEPVVVMDFNSLYPSIMMAYGLSPESFAGTKNMTWDGSAEHLAQYDGEQLQVFVGSDTFALFNKVSQPVIPKILSQLIQERKSVRKNMALLPEDAVLERSQHHAKQLALKILANSIYGTCGFANGPLPLVEIAAATTAIGRMSIQNVRSRLSVLGYSRVVAGDTDSVMVLMEQKSIHEAIETAKFLCNDLNRLFPPPMKIEFEKVYHPYLVLTKKRYAGLLWEDATKSPKRDTKGIATKRRDFSPIVVKAVSKIIDLILWGRDVEAAGRYVHDVLISITEATIPIEDLIVRKELKKRPCDYSTPTPHSVTAAKIMKRDPESAPKLGERIPFIITSGSGDISERAEDPSEVKKRGIEIDYMYYLQNQLQNPILEIFRATHCDEVAKKVEFMFHNCARIVNLKRQKQRQITDFFTNV